jgi:pre-mRNA-splicing factor CWC22
MENEEKYKSIKTEILGDEDEDDESGEEEDDESDDDEGM